MQDYIKTPQSSFLSHQKQIKSESQDFEVSNLIARETRRQEEEISLIASENHTYQEVLEAAGSVLTDKYAEGYPGKRYYAGCSVVDEVELLAINRCKKLFGAEHVNVQPHAGSQANFAVYAALLQPGDTILGMSLAHGGHLTHGHGVNISGMLYKSVHYGVDQETECLDYDVIERLAHEHKPKLIIAGASAYSQIIDFERFAAIARQVGAILMADIAHIAGLVAAGMHPTPIGHADIVTSTTHKTLRGPRGGFIMCSAQYADRIDRAVMPGIQGGPFMNTILAKAVAFGKALHPDFLCYQEQVIANSQAMADEFINRGYRIVSGGTKNHLFIVDLRSHAISGRDAESLLQAVGINVSRSCIPFDPQKPWITSGIRIGSPSITSRGIRQESARELVGLIDAMLLAPHCTATSERVKQALAQICAANPVR